MTFPRGLSPDEAAIWRRVTATVKPLEGKAPAAQDPAARSLDPNVARPAESPRRKPPHDVEGEKTRRPAPAEPRSLTRHGLDGSWERRLAQAQVAPDLTIDLHGMNLDQAHARVLGGLAQASATGARVILVIAGKPRPHGDHDQRGERRGAIRAKLLDWLAASDQAGRIAAVRPAHPRHGGSGAVYVILRRRR